MAQLVFEIKNQWISRTDTFKPVAKSKNYLYAQFNFLTDEWVGVPTAIFRNKTSAYEQIIGQDGTCLVPWEVIDVEGDSEIFVSVFCGDLVTANKARVHVYDTGYGDDLESSTPPTPSVYEQILNRMDDIEEDMDDATRRAETAAENAEEASAHYPVILEDYWYVWDVTEREYVNTDIKAEGHDGTSATVEVVQVVGGHRIVITDVSGEHVFDVPDGHDGTDGRGIASLEKTSTSGDVDQYTMTFSDGSEPFVYYVTNGASATISTRAITNGYRLTITDKNGTRAIDVLNGAKGDPGNGIQSINKIGSYENYDYYEIRMTNGNKTSFTVTNGYSPTVEIVNITGGHRVVITDTNGAHSFDVMDGEGGGGVAIHICSSSEYDHTTGVPTIQNPEENTFYLVPSSESATHDMFAEWVYVNNAWEMFGSASIDLSNYATKTDLNTKVDKVAGKGLSTNDYTTEEKNKLSGIEAQANKTVVDDALSSTSTNPVQNKKVKEALDNLDAGDIAYDDTETYSNGTVGKGLTSLKAEINQLSVDKADIIISNASGAIASFTDGADGLPMESVVAHIEPVQSGTGDPSPTNVRPISGWTGANVAVSPTEDAQDGTTYTVSWQTEAGTVYGGYVDVTQGKLVVEKASIEFDGSNDETWQKYSVTQGELFRITVKNRKTGELIANDAKCNSFKVVLTANRTSGTVSSSAGNVTNADFLLEGISTLDAWKEWLSSNPVQLVYKLATPIEYDIDPVTIELLKGYNNVWTNVGGNVDVDYRADTKLYLESHMPEIPVEDVQVNGTSVVNQGVANVPIGSANELGVVKKLLAYGIDITGSGQLLLISPTDDNIKKGYSGSRLAIMTLNQHLATFYGLAKIAGADERNSTLPAGQYTDAAKIAIQKMLGIYEPPWELLNDITLDAEGGIDLTADSNGTPYNLLGVFIYVFYPANTPTATGGYGRYRVYDSNNRYCNSETGKYTTATSGKYKYISLDRRNNLALLNYTVQQPTGNSSAWYIKTVGTTINETLLSNSGGALLNLGNIVRIAMPSGDVEPEGTRIQIYGQRAY